MDNFLIWAVLGLVNLLAFVYVGRDKSKSVQHSERSPEVGFFLWAAFFGSLGIFAGMFFFRHKTRKIYFPLGIGAVLVQQILLAYLIFKFYGGI